MIHSPGSSFAFLNQLILRHWLQPIRKESRPLHCGGEHTCVIACVKKSVLKREPPAAGPIKEELQVVCIRSHFTVNDDCIGKGVFPTRRVSVLNWDQLLCRLSPSHISKEDVAANHGTIRNPPQKYAGNASFSGEMQYQPLIFQRAVGCIIFTSTADAIQVKVVFRPQQIGCSRSWNLPF